MPASVLVVKKVTGSTAERKARRNFCFGFSGAAFQMKLVLKFGKIPKTRCCIWALTCSSAICSLVTVTLALETIPPLMSKTYPLMLAVDCGVSDCGEGDSQPGALGRSDSPVAGSDVCRAAICCGKRVGERPRKERPRKRTPRTRPRKFRGRGK